MRVKKKKKASILLLFLGLIHYADKEKKPFKYIKITRKGQVMKKYIMHAFFIGLACLAGTIQAKKMGYTHVIKNGSRFPADFRVTYLGCRDAEPFTLQPGQVKPIPAAFCTLTGVHATVNEQRTMISSAEGMPAVKKVKASAYRSSRHGNGTWVLAGPINTDTPGEFEYIVTQVVQ
jgi:hypothetical protein